MKKGNVFIGAMFLVAGGLIVILFLMAIFTSQVNAVLYRLKIDMYTLNKSGIIAVNKGNTSVDQFSYHTKSYRNYFEEGLKKNYHLNDALENENQLIEKIKIKEYKILEKGNLDSFNKKTSEDRILHMVIEVKMKPIVMQDWLGDVFVFTIHEDVNCNTAFERTRQKERKNL